jgi:predicted ATPase
MKIDKLQISGLHGYLSFDLAFFPDLTFLIGINGSGKTSAVRALVAVLAPAVRDLARLDFKRIAVTASHENVQITAVAERSDTEVILSVEGLEERLRIPVLGRPRFDTRNWEDREVEYYREQEALHAKHPVLERIAALPTPMFLDLERRAQVGIARRTVSMRAPVRDHTFTPTLLGGSLLESLRDAQSLAEDAYRQNQAAQRVLADRLKQDLILTHFRAESETRPVSLKLPTAAELGRLRHRQRLVNESLAAIGISQDEIDGTVATFFSTVYSTVDTLKDKNLTQLLLQTSPDAQLVGRWLALHPQLDRIDGVINHVEQYNKRVEGVFRPVQRYLELVNKFLKDSGKQLAFSPTGDLKVNLEGKEKARPITALSSGERQLVVMLTHLAFNTAARRANVLIVDEPELSLHIRWQEQFVEALQGASEGLQLILATHSPSIIMANDDRCVDVLEARA